MNINIKMIEKLEACEEGIVWFKEKYGNKTIDLDTLAKDLISEDREEWLSWVITKNLSKDDNVRYAIFSAELVLHIFEEKYPNDKRPRKAIEAAKNYLDDPISADKDAAGDAVWAAGAAARAAARAADWAAGEADWAAARAAGWAAARAAGWAAGEAADDAAGAAARAAGWAAGAAAFKKTYKKILDYGIELLINKIEEKLCFQQK